jgi:glycosyltransferase involved in cell wall biosynthesis
MLEAMAMGLPIVASQVGSIPEIIDGNGYLVCVLQPEETSSALQDLSANPALRARMAQRSRELARRYDIDDMVKGYEAALIDAVRMSRTRRRPVAGRRSSRKP